MKTLTDAQIHGLRILYAGSSSTDGNIWFPIEGKIVRRATLDILAKRGYIEWKYVHNRDHWRITPKGVKFISAFDHRITALGR